MIWTPRLLCCLMIPLATLPVALSPRLTRPMPIPAPAPAAERTGFTLGADGKRNVVVTSLRTGGPADQSHIAVGDIVRKIDGQRTTGVTMSRTLILKAAGCDITVELEHDGVRHLARLQQCAKDRG